MNNEYETVQCKRNSLVFEPNVVDLINTSHIIQIACIYFEIKLIKNLLLKYCNYNSQIIPNMVQH